MDTLVYIVPSILASVIGQLLLKRGMTGLGPLSLGEGNVLSMVWSMATSPWVLLGLMCYVGGTLFWLIALSRAELSFVYPFAALSMALIILSSWLIFGESISVARVFGVATIVAGVLIVARS
jgi:drug/metabolite transporter (DMT)-like permease